MESVKTLLNFLNKFCEKQHKNGGCVHCENQDICKLEIWENAETELKNAGLIIKLI